MLAAVLLTFQTPAFDFTYTSGHGLDITTNGVQIVRGSSFQYYQPGWGKGYYSSSWSTQKVTKVDADNILVEWSQDDSSGNAKIHRSGDTLTADYTLAWSGEKPVNAEVSPGLIWAPAFDHGSLLADGKETRKLDTQNYTTPGFDQRRFSPDATSYLLDSPVATVSVKTDQPLMFFDGRGYDQDWAQGRRMWWLGYQEVQTSKAKPATLHIEWKITPKPIAAARQDKAALPSKAVTNAVTPDESIPPLIPQPKTSTLRFDKPMVLTGQYKFPIGRVRFWEDFTSGLARRFQPQTPAKGVPAISVDGGVSKLGFKPGGYKISIEQDSISVLGEEDEGLRNGLRRLAQLAFVKNGKLMLPTGDMLDSPSIAWRGVHLFVGPDARQFQHKLWERVLLPLGLNQIVLQCEQTDWKSTGDIRSKISMKKQDLAGLFADYRAVGIEPVPLIQSWGHMEWLFANGRNKELSFNPDVHYAIDPRKPEARKMIESIWDEAIDLLKPKQIHFGLDEVCMRGYPDDPGLVTKSWEEYIPFLADYAKRKNVDWMIWGDQMLAPDETTDAGQAPDRKNAALRRAVLPKGTMIADWHYKGDAFGAFIPTLRMWQSAGMRTISAGWYTPENVSGLAQASDVMQAGYLQTTWAGYESNEQSLLENIPQFSAMVLAAEYTWSGRSEKPDKLGYDPIEVFRKMYFGTPSPIQDQPGVMFGNGDQQRTVGGVRFAVGSPLALRSILKDETASLPTSVSIALTGTTSSVDLAIDTAVQADDREAVADVIITLANGKTVLRTVRYGQDVRAADDLSATTVTPRTGGLSLLRMPVSGAVKSLEVRARNPYAGLRLYGVTLER